MFKIIHSRLALHALVLLFVTTLFSFEKIGGDSYSILLNDRLLLQHYVHSNKEVKPVSIGDASTSDVLSIRYSHCGKIGTARNISIKDMQNNVLKDIHFPDASGEALLSMTIKVRDIVALQRSNSGKRVKLFYSSKELPDGLMLAPLDLPDNTKASLK
jgi:hypothetical protein